jgi:multiple sugar transport system substrate-binding protein
MKFAARVRSAWAPLLACFALAAAVGACGGDDTSSSGSPTLKKAETLKDPASPVTITYVGAAYSADDLEPVFAAFEKQHPNIKVKYEATPFDQLNNVLAARLGSKDKGIDVFDVDMPRVAAYNARGWLTDLTPSFGDLKGKIDQASLDTTTIGGKLLAMPFQTSSQLLYYNKGLLKKAGIADPAADPAQRPTWEQIAADAKRAKDAGAKWGLLFDQFDRYYQLQPLPMSLGGSAGGKGEGNLEPDVTGPEWVKAFDWYGKLYADKLSPRGLTVAETPNVFAAGQVAYFVGGPWWAPQFEAKKKLDFGVAAHPVFQGGKPYTSTGGWGLGVNKQSQNLDAALIFARFMGLDDGGFSQYMSSLAVPPTNVAGTARYFEQDVFKDPRMKGAVDILKYELANTAVVRLKTVGYVEFEDIMGKAFGDIVNGTPAQQALERASGQLDAAWKKYR